MCLAWGINILGRLLQAALMVNVSYTLTMTFAIRGELSQFLSFLLVIEKRTKEREWEWFKNDVVIDLLKRDEPNWQLTPHPIVHLHAEFLH